MSADDSSDVWRRVRKHAFSRRRIVFAAVAIWAGLVVNYVLPNAAPVAGLVVIPICGFVLAWLAEGAVSFRPILAGVWPPIDVPAPQEKAGENKVEHYVVSPEPHYPILAAARGQCGWVQLKLRVNASGGIDSYQVASQAPGRMFENAVVFSLNKALLKPGNPRDVTNVISFVLPDGKMPEWAKARSAGAPRGPWDF